MAVEKFIIETFQETVQSRRENDIVRNDLLQLLMQLMDRGCIGDVEEYQNKEIKNGTDESE